MPTHLIVRSTAALAVFAVCGCALPAVAAQDDGHGETLIARGMVFHDANENGHCDDGEMGIAGVPVSNGTDVVLTGAGGRYEIPINAHDDIIFVCKPHNWRTVMDPQHLWRGYYIHKPEGSPDDEYVYKGVKPTGPLPSDIDFPLFRTEEPDRFRALFVGDPQPYNILEMDWYAKDVFAEIIEYVEHINTEHATDAPVLFGVSMGDLVGDDLDLFGPLNNVQAEAGIPWYNVYGNHDMNFMSPNDADADETYEATYGPTDYAFQFGPVHFIVLDDVVWQGFTRRRDDGRPDGGNYRGGLSESQIAFVRNYLTYVPSEQLVVLLFHIPIEGGGVHRIPEQAALFDALATHPNTISLSGHTHFQRHWHFTSAQGMAEGAEHFHLNGATASGSWYRGATDEEGIPHTTMRCGAPNGYNIILFDGNTFVPTFKGARRPADDQMHIWVTPDLTSSTRDGEVIVNVYGGNDRSAVEMRIDNGAWTTMAFTPRADPFYLEMKALENSDTPPNGRPLPGVEDSYHIWSAPLTERLEPGVHQIEVRTKDEWGQAFTERTLIRVEPGGISPAL